MKISITKDKKIWKVGSDLPNDRPMTGPTVERAFMRYILSIRGILGIELAEGGSVVKIPSSALITARIKQAQELVRPSHLYNRD